MCREAVPLIRYYQFLRWQKLVSCHASHWALVPCVDISVHFLLLCVFHWQTNHHESRWIRVGFIATKLKFVISKYFPPLFHLKYTLADIQTILPQSFGTAEYFPQL